MSECAPKPFADYLFIKTVFLPVALYSVVSDSGCVCFAPRGLRTTASWLVPRPSRHLARHVRETADATSRERNRVCGVPDRDPYTGAVL